MREGERLGGGGGGKLLRQPVQTRHNIHDIVYTVIVHVCHPLHST